MKIVTCFISELSSTMDTAFIWYCLTSSERQFKKVHVNRDGTCSKFFHFGPGHVGVCKYTNDLGIYLLHAVSLTHPKSHYDTPPQSSDGK